MAVLEITSALRAITAEADVKVDFDVCGGVQNLLINGILLSKGTKKLVLDKSLKAYTIIFFARALSITWVDDPRYWKWIRQGCGSSPEVAELIRVSWLNISGMIHGSKLLSGVLYEVVFEIFINCGASGFEIPVNLKLTVPNQSAHEHKVCLNTFTREQWVEVPVGTFTLSEDDLSGCGCNDIEFSLFEHGGHWKSGLLVKSATIRPKLLCG